MQSQPNVGAGFVAISAEGTLLILIKKKFTKYKFSLLICIVFTTHFLRTTLNLNSIAQNSISNKNNVRNIVLDPFSHLISQETTFKIRNTLI